VLAAVGVVVDRLVEAGVIEPEHVMQGLDGRRAVDVVGGAGLGVALVVDSLGGVVVGPVVCLVVGLGGVLGAHRPPGRRVAGLALAPGHRALPGGRDVAHAVSPPCVRRATCRRHSAGGSASSGSSR
jgi:hypothetical protein